MGKIYGLLGRHLGHSWSSVIHEKLGLPGYEMIEKEPDELLCFLKSADIGGLNVTIPYKVAVMEYCDKLSPLAEEIGSVNTLVRDESGALCGWNTDAVGFERMAQGAGIGIRDKKVLVLGSGGASKTAAAVCRRSGAASVTVISRNGADNYGNLDRHRDADIIVNTTPVGMFPDCEGKPVDLTLFPGLTGVLDVVYNPSRTRLLMQAEELGIRHGGGLSMLVYQAAAAEEIFFGRAIPGNEPERVLRELRAETENIVLIGMPGSGKTTVGKQLAELTGRELIDIDDEIVKRAGMSIPDIFSKYGEAHFRQLERGETAKAGKRTGIIIVTGGGVVKDPHNLPPLRMNGRIYQLVRDIDALPRDGRPLSQNADLRAMYGERAPMYEAFRDAAVDNNGLPADAAAEIWRDHIENTCDQRP